MDNIKKLPIIVGKLPPPIGGVTIHVTRLLSALNEARVNSEFVELTYSNLPRVAKHIFLKDLVHLHASNVILRFTFSLLSFLFRGKLFMTIHGNLGRYGRFYNTLDAIAIRMVYCPILINENSYVLAFKINKRSKLISAFIPPCNVGLLPREVFYGLEIFIPKFKHCFSTNAFDVSYDKNMDEVYGVTALIELFCSIKDYGLVFSDPTGNYSSFLARKKIEIPENVFIVTGSHDFVAVLHETDGLIRNTTTDGDSLSVKEALYYGKTVFATSCVDRPSDCVLYDVGDMEELKMLITKFFPRKNIGSEIQDGAIDLINLYKETLTIP